jgi:hypothetical protein
MNQKPQAADARSTASRRLRVALLLGATGIASTTALIAVYGPKIPPYQGD